MIITLKVEPPERKERWYTIRLFATNSLQEGAMWHINSLLGNACNTRAANNTGAVFSLCPQWHHTMVCSGHVTCIL
jgi:hypothetical protein